MLIGAAALFGGACGTSEPVSTPAPPGGCDALADEVANLVVDLAEHAAGTGSGLPAEVLEVEHPDAVDVWEVAASLADGSPDLQGRVAAVASAAGDASCEPGWAHVVVDRRAAQRLSEGKQRLEQGFDREEYTTLNLVAILAANLAPPPEAHEVPDGFPPEFPVHPDAELTSSERHDDGSVMATWTIKSGSVTEVADYYQTRLQEIRFGGWSVGSSSGAGGSDGSGGRHSFEIDGYSFTGRVSVEADDDPADVIVTATLARQS